MKSKHSIILITALSLSLSFATYAFSAQQKPKDAKGAKEGYVGSETCQGCHPEVHQAFVKGRHGKTECEACHGPGAKHAEAQEKGSIFSFKEGDAVVRSDTCLKCHQKQKEFFQFRRGAHKLGAVACDSCHGIHGSKAEHLLKSKDPELCLSCHQEVRGQFSLPSRHRVLDGAMTCSECHTPHGTRTRASLRTWNKFSTDVCFKCHPEKRGPWVFEHSPIKVDGCSICHAPHGSPNRFLLTARDVRRVCLQCHGKVHFNPLSCVNCHTQIHGSNFSNRFFQ
jgi:DmsE family decaheme c-type cytochrome